jgi:SNF2 family DNA or RNA helicase
MAKYKFKTTPYKHQYAALKKLLEQEWGGALLMEPRTGKTKVSIDFASIRHQQGLVSRVLVVCPVSIIDVWVDEIAAHCPFKYTITIWDKKGRKRNELPKYGRTTLDFVIINYDAFSTPGKSTGRREDGSLVRSRKRGGRYDVVRALKAWSPQLLVLDESHRIKSPSAKKSTALVRLGPVADYRLICTGTAVTKAKRTFDLYMQWKFLNPESPLLIDEDGSRHTSASFKAEYGRWITLGVPGRPRATYDKFVGVRHNPKLRRLVHAESFAVTRDECFDLPPAYPDQKIYVDLEESADVYDQMAEEMVAKIKSGEYTEASIRLVQNLRLSQIASGIARTEPTDKYPRGRLVRIGREKLRVLEDLLEDWFDQEEKLVVCARFRADIQGVAQLCSSPKLRGFKVQPNLIIGGQKRTERTNHIRTFREKPGPALMVMNPQAGSLGIDLRTASTMIWYNITQSYVDHTQSRDRNALSGKANRYIYLQARGTIDELHYESYLTDQDVVKMIHESPERLLRNFK